MNNVLMARCTRENCFYHNQPFPVPAATNRCLLCGSSIVFENRANSHVDDNLWFEDAFNGFPCVLAHEYKRLYDLYQNRKNYGVLLQLKDVIESTIKFCVLVTASWGKYQRIEGREDKYEKSLGKKQLSLGEWVYIASQIRSFYKALKGKEQALPQPIWNLIDKLLPWENSNQLVKWRNQSLAHGALAFEDDTDFQEKLITQIQAITEFYKTNAKWFNAIQITSGKRVLQGSTNARNLIEEKGDCEIIIDETSSFSCYPFIVHMNHGIYFFDEVVNRRESRFLSYPMGRFDIHSNEYAEHLVESYQSNNTIREATIDSEFLSSTENDYLARLCCDGICLEPSYISNWLRRMLSTHSKGIFMLEMERGCGKSFYTEKLNRRFKGAWIIDDEFDVRTYHLSRTQFGGLQEFLNGITSEWNQGFNSHLERSIILSASRDNDEINRHQLVEFLNKFREYSAHTSDRQYKEKILLVLDGLDEIRETDSRVWSFIPKPDELLDGVFILVTGRCPEEHDTSEQYAHRLGKLSFTEAPLKVYRSSDLNISFLQAYVKSRIPHADDELISHIIESSDKTILSVAMLCDLYSHNGSLNFDFESTNDLVAQYLKMVLNCYASEKANDLYQLLVILSEISIHEPMTLQEIADLLYLGSVRLELLGMLSDISPLLSVDRTIVINNEEYSDSNRYHLINPDIATAISSFVGDEKRKSIIDHLVTLFRKCITSEEPYAVSGMSIIGSHLSAIMRNNTFLCFNVEEINGINAFIRHYANEHHYSYALHNRQFYTHQEIIECWDNGSEDIKHGTMKAIAESFFQCNRVFLDHSCYSDEHYANTVDSALRYLKYCEGMQDNIEKAICKLKFYLPMYWSYTMMHLNQNAAMCLKTIIGIADDIEQNRSDDMVLLMAYQNADLWYYGSFQESQKRGQEDRNLLDCAIKYQEKALVYANKLINAEDMVILELCYDAYLCYADALDDAGKSEEAERYYNKVISLIEPRIKPDNPYGFGALFHAYGNYTVFCMAHDRDSVTCKETAMKAINLVTDSRNAIIAVKGVVEYCHIVSRLMPIVLELYKRTKDRDYTTAYEMMFVEVDRCFSFLPDENEIILRKYEFYYKHIDGIWITNAKLDALYYLEKGIKSFTTLYKIMSPLGKKMVGDMCLKYVKLAYAGENYDTSNVLQYINLGLEAMAGIERDKSNNTDYEELLSYKRMYDFWN